MQLRWLLCRCGCVTHTVSAASTHASQEPASEVVFVQVRSAKHQWATRQLIQRAEVPHCRNPVTSHQLVPGGKSATTVQFSTVAPLGKSMRAQMAAGVLPPCGVRVIPGGTVTSGGTWMMKLLLPGDVVPPTLELQKATQQQDGMLGVGNTVEARGRQRALWALCLTNYSYTCN